MDAHETPTEHTETDSDDTQAGTRRAKESRPRISRRLGKDQYEHVCKIYFIEAVGMDLIKIGYTIDPVKRFMGMLTVSPAPLSLLGSIWGGPQKELEIHAKLDAYRLHGEWFKKVPAVMEVVATAEQSYGDDLLNQVARQRGAALMEYLAKLKAGEIVRPTRGPLKRRRSVQGKNLPYVPAATFRGEPLLAPPKEPTG